MANISEQLLAYMQAQKEKSGTDKNTLKYWQDHWHELGFSTLQACELAWFAEQEQPQDQSTRRDSVEKNPYSSAISAKKAARSAQPLNAGANFENTVRKPKL